MFALTGAVQNSQHVAYLVHIRLLPHHGVAQDSPVVNVHVAQTLLELEVNLDFGQLRRVVV